MIGTMLRIKGTPYCSICISVLALVLVPSSPGMSDGRWQAGEANDDEKSLIAILRDDQARQRDPVRVEKAIRRLGEMRSVAATEDLIGLLTFGSVLEMENPDPRVNESGRLISFLGHYPAAIALFDIGKPALSALVRVVETNETTALETKIAIHTIMNIFREEPPNGPRYLRRVARRSPSQEAAGRLLKAAETAQALVH
jgi:hypothetical protein